MTFPSRLSRALAATSAASFLAIVLAYALGPSDRWHRTLIADASWTWAAVFASLACGLALRRAPRGERRAWRWIGGGCAAFLVGQMAWNYYDLWLRVRPPYPSLADIAFLVTYPCFGMAVRDLVQLQPQRRPDPEVAIDAGLVTFTAVALTYAYLVAPLLQTGGPPLAVAASVGWGAGSVAVLWAILRQMVRRRGFPLGTAGAVTLGFVVLSITDIAYASRALSGAYATGGGLDLGWDAGLLLIGAAAALAPEYAMAPDAGTRGLSSETARAIAVLTAVAGIAALAITGLLHPEAAATTAPWVAAGIAIIGARFVYALRADRRYAALLEDEVAAQTRSLMSSLGATAAAERNLRLVMEAVPDAIVVLDRDGRALDMNRAARAIAGAPAEGGAARTIFDFLDAGAGPVVRQNLDATFRGDVRRFEVSFRRPDGSRGVSAMLYAPIRDGRRVFQVLALVRDVTDQRRAESQLQQAEKLAAMSQLVSGVAHEINNPAAIISGFAQTLLLDDVKPEHREMAQMIYDEASRIGRITQNLLAFARAGGKERTLVDLNDVLRRTFALRSYHLSTLNIAVSLDLDPTDPKIWANASEVQQLFLNLVINAEQALLTVETARTITIRSASTEAEVQLEVADNGPGVTPDIRGRVFDPFFTTKPEGVGTGLGLSICYGIVSDHGGRIWLESEPGRGAKFLVALPRDPRTETRVIAEPAVEAGGGRATTGAISVLLLDDETALRNALLRFLTRRGIDATGVGDGGEALSRLKQHDFDVIVSDVRMPGMSGGDFIAHLRRERPELIARLIFSTGDSFATETAALIQDVGVPTVSKPFDFSTLEQLIRDVAARTRPPEAPSTQDQTNRPIS